MAGLSTYLSDAILNWIKSSAFPSDPAAVYVALFDGDPGDDGLGGTEVTDDVNAGGRVAVTFGSIVAKAISNSADVDFGDSDNDVDISHFGVFDAATSGNYLGGSSLDTPRSPVTGDPVKFAIGALTIDLA